MPQMGQLPPVRELTADSAGTGFFLCVQKDVRVGKNGEFIALVLQDATGRIAAKVFDGVDRLRNEFDAGEFVKVRARANLYNERLQLIVENIRRVHREQDAAAGFREEDCLPTAPQPADEMWAELEALVEQVRDPFIGKLLRRVTARFERELKIWPAAQTIHHAYRGGFLEHVLAIADVVVPVARAYGAREDLVIAGAILHDIGKLEELDYELTASYSDEGYLVGHITLGVIIVRDEAGAIEGFPPTLLTEIEHLIVSHHGSREFGSPIEPMTVEAFVVAAADDLDAKINQVRQAIQDDAGDQAFTSYHPRLKRVLWKG
jgi:3'-5' exoribonuclease